MDLPSKVFIIDSFSDGIYYMGIKGGYIYFQVDGEIIRFKFKIGMDLKIKDHIYNNIRPNKDGSITFNF